jgi:catechol 2,3-dioxygenase-like lactoylglutathione lyase family enzyme
MTVIANDDRNRAMFHSGMVVTNLEESAAQYCELFGLRWAPPRPSRLQVRVDGILQQVELVATYSVQGPPYLELIEEISGSVWASEALGLNHVGFWASDLPSAAKALERSGLPARAFDEDADEAMKRFSYHRGTDGIWLELVCPSFEPKLAEWLASGN